MSWTRESLLVMGFCLLVGLTVVCTHFGIGISAESVTGVIEGEGIVAQVWASIDWLWSAITFQLTDGFGMITIFIWVILVSCIMLPMGLILIEVLGDLIPL